MLSCCALSCYFKVVVYHSTAHTCAVCCRADADEDDDDDDDEDEENRPRKPRPRVIKTLLKEAEEESGLSESLMLTHFDNRSANMSAGGCMAVCMSDQTELCRGQCACYCWVCARQARAILMSKPGHFA